MRILEFIRIGMICSAAMISCVSIAAGAGTTELIVVESDDCPYCKQFHAEVGTVYPKTTEGKTAPLRTWQLGTPFPANYLLADSVTFTPTFLLLHNGKEIDRLVGYPGDEFFWFLIAEMLAKLDQ